MIAPFPWFGGKRRIAETVWQRFGNVQNYVEPFFGSGAVLLGRPHAPRVETVNDADGFVVNFWRAVQHDPAAVAHHADQPVYESDLHARHAWLVEQRATLTARLEGDPSFYDTQIAGWWVWGVRIWIGSGWCFGDGPWRRSTNRLVRAHDVAGGGRSTLPPQARQGTERICGGGQAPAPAALGIHRNLPKIGGNRASIGSPSTSVGQREASRCGGGHFDAISERLRRVRVTCGDWSRIMTPAVTVQNGLTGVLLDPPYATDTREDNIYARDSGSISGDVRAWCLENGDNPMLRIALCGYQNEHDELVERGWSPHYWKAQGGYGNQSDGRGRENAQREVIWFSPHCLNEPRAVQPDLFDLEVFS